MTTYHSIPGTTPLACKFYNIMRTSIGLSDHAPADLQSPEPGTLTRFSAGKTGIHTKKELLLRFIPQEQFIFYRLYAIFS